MDTGAEPITDDAERACIQRQARHIQLQSLSLAVMLTVLTLLIH